MAERYAHLTGCARMEVLPVPVPRGQAEILHLLPNGPVQAHVLAVHGFGCNRIFPNLTAYRLFLQMGLGVLCVPLPGHHPGVPPLGTPWLPDYLPRVATGLQQRFGIVPTVAYGNSLGALLTLASMPELPDLRVGVFLQPPLWVSLGYGDLAREVLTTVNRDLLNAFEFPVSAVLEMARLRARLVDQDGRERLRNFLHPTTLPAVQRMVDHLDVPSRLSRVRGRQILLLTGEHDRVAPPHDVSRLAGWVPDGIEVGVVARATHTTLFFVDETMSRTRSWLHARWERIRLQEPLTV